MHPALSIILFTTLSGIGYGMLFWLGLFAAAVALPPDVGFGAASFALALGAISFGLLSSTAHLGHRERAWRALSQWRSSWLSREGVAALLTYLPAGLLALAWIFPDRLGGLRGIAGAFAAIGAVATVTCTAFIYSSLKPIRAWNNGWVLPNYLALAATTGGLWLAAIAALLGTERSLAASAALVAILIAAPLKLAYWRRIDHAPAASSVGSATGLDMFGQVRLFEAPHTSENYLLKEMGYAIARKHAAKLRAIAFGCAFALPLLLTGLCLAIPGWPGGAAVILAAPLATLGAAIERWLFFAEAKHSVTLYYGASRA